MTTRELLSDDGRRRTFRVLDGAVEVGRDIETILTVEETNARTMEGKADSILAANATFLALASPSNAQIAAQVKVLTRVTSLLLRLLLRRTETTDGT